MARPDLEFPPDLRGRLAELITDADDVKIVETLRAALDADTSTRTPRGKGEPNNYAFVPDWRIRVLAAKIMAEMKHGRPNQSVDLNVRGTLNLPMSREQAAKELLANWDDVKRIGDEHVRLLKEAVPTAPDGNQAQDAAATVVDVDI